jgi:hypothetical protein
MCALQIKQFTMKNSFKASILFAILLTAIFGRGLHAQDGPKKYSSSSIEIIFSFADIDIDQQNVSTVLRFAPVLNLQYLYNIDFSDQFGFFTGLDLRNLGFIFKNDMNQRWKHRVYAIGLPVGLKFGNLDNGLFIYGGGQLEYAFNYKEKYFLNDDKQYSNVYWFTDRVNPLQFSLLLGINLPHGLNIKFKYYLTDLMNRDYKAFTDSGQEYFPYGGYSSSNVFYFSLNFNLFYPNYKYFE